MSMNTMTHCRKKKSNCTSKSCLKKKKETSLFDPETCHLAHLVTPNHRLKYRIGSSTRLFHMVFMTMNTMAQVRSN